MLHKLASFCTSVGFGNLMLVMILVLSSLTWIGNAKILESVRKQEMPPVTTQYLDVSGQTRIVNSPMQSTPEENVRVHNAYLKAAYCAYEPAVWPPGFSQADCP